MVIVSDDCGGTTPFFDVDHRSIIYPSRIQLSPPITPPQTVPSDPSRSGPGFRVVSCGNPPYPPYPPRPAGIRPNRGAGHHQGCGRCQAREKPGEANPLLRQKR